MPAVRPRQEEGQPEGELRQPEEEQSLEYSPTSPLPDDADLPLVPSDDEIEAQLTNDASGVDVERLIEDNSYMPITRAATGPLYRHEPFLRARQRQKADN